VESGVWRHAAADVVKMICLGANRVSFGTLAMVASAVRSARDCQAELPYRHYHQIANVDRLKHGGCAIFAPIVITK
jgi:hypothetical protein